MSNSSNLLAAGPSMRQPSKVVILGGPTETVLELGKLGIPVPERFSFTDAEMNWSVFSKFSIILIEPSLLPLRRRIFGRLRAACPGICFAFLIQSNDPASLAPYSPAVKSILLAEFHLSSESSNASWKHAKELKALFPIPLTTELVPSDEIFELEKIRTFLQNNYSTPTLSLQGAAKQLNMKANVIRFLLQRHLGLSFRQALSEVRLGAARKLLDRNSPGTVKSVAVEVGFGNADYLSRRFKSHFGVNASKLRPESDQVLSGSK